MVGVVCAVSLLFQDQPSLVALLELGQPDLEGLPHGFKLLLEVPVQLRLGICIRGGGLEINR